MLVSLCFLHLLMSISFPNPAIPHRLTDTPTALSDSLPPGKTSSESAKGWTQYSSNTLHNTKLHGYHLPHFRCSTPINITQEPSMLQLGPQSPWDTLLPSLPLAIVGPPNISTLLQPAIPLPLPHTTPPFILLPPDYELACLWVWLVSSTWTTPFGMYVPSSGKPFQRPSQAPGWTPSLCCQRTISCPDGDTLHEPLEGRLSGSPLGLLARSTPMHGAQ